ncbi:hypothetical protein D3C71_2125960 [compost metagenome]
MKPKLKSELVQPIKTQRKIKKPTRLPAINMLSNKDEYLVAIESVEKPALRKAPNE